MLLLSKEWPLFTQDKTQGKSTISGVRSRSLFNYYDDEKSLSLAENIRDVVTTSFAEERLFEVEFEPCDRCAGYPPRYGDEAMCCFKYKIYLRGPKSGAKYDLVKDVIRPPDPTIDGDVGVAMNLWLEIDGVPVVDDNNALLGVGQAVYKGIDITGAFESKDPSDWEDVSGQGSRYQYQFTNEADLRRCVCIPRDKINRVTVRGVLQYTRSGWNYNEDLGVQSPTLSCPDCDIHLTLEVKPCRGWEGWSMPEDARNRLAGLLEKKCKINPHGISCCLYISLDKCNIKGTDKCCVYGIEILDDRDNTTWSYGGVLGSDIPPDYAQYAPMKPGTYVVPIGTGKDELKNDAEITILLYDECRRVIHRQSKIIDCCKLDVDVDRPRKHDIIHPLEHEPEYIE